LVELPFSGFTLADKDGSLSRHHFRAERTADVNSMAMGTLQGVQAGR
jgi:hypothetical protein